MDVVVPVVVAVVVPVVVAVVVPGVVAVVVPEVVPVEVVPAVVADVVGAALVAAAKRLNPVAASAEAAVSRDAATEATMKPGVGLRIGESPCRSFVSGSIGFGAIRLPAPVVRSVSVVELGRPFAE